MSLGDILDSLPDIVKVSDTVPLAVLSPAWGSE